MSLIAGWDNVRRFLQDERPNTVQLAVITVNEIDGYTLKNYPPVTHIEYAAEQQSGQYILVTRPYYDWNGGVILHYGLPEEMEKREVVRFLRASDGGSTWITFMVGSKSYEAFFGVKLDSTGFSYGKAWLKIGNDTLNLERKNADRQTLQILGFDCSIELK